MKKINIILSSLILLTPISVDIALARTEFNYIVDDGFGFDYNIPIEEAIGTYRKCPNTDEEVYYSKKGSPINTLTYNDLIVVEPHTLIVQGGNGLSLIGSEDEPPDVTVPAKRLDATTKEILDANIEINPAYLCRIEQ